MSRALAWWHGLRLSDGRENLMGTRHHLDRPTAASAGSTGRPAPHCGPPTLWGSLKNMSLYR